MSPSEMFSRRQWRLFRICLCTLVAICVFFQIAPKHKNEQPFEVRKTLYPLAWKHVHMSAGHGGSWYIPPDWISNTSSTPETILDAARLAAKIANSTPDLFLDHSTIPRMIHQTWKSTDLNEIPVGTLPGIERWLQYATQDGYPSMAYFMWNDEGIMLMMDEMDSAIRESFIALPQFVEKTDVFRVIVCNTIGGIYSDIDTVPLSLPSTWIRENDLATWTDSQSNKTYSPVRDTTNPVGLILGIEADTPEDSDSFWRMGYSFPVQLTQWTLASAANNGILNEFISDWHSKMQSMYHYESLVDSESHLAPQSLTGTDPLTLTGPGAITKAAKTYLERESGLRWQALSGLEDGGRGKVVDQTLILPITGFSPGRGSYGNMGSKPISDPEARVQHIAQGSWRKLSLMVESGNGRMMAPLYKPVSMIYEMSDIEDAIAGI